MQNINPITRLDYPDTDVIRVEDTYYMISTTMYFMPGGEILRSYDLVNWEHASFVYDVLDSTPKQTLSGDENAYGKGMWAASLRYHDKTFYVCFAANDTGKTYLFSTESIEGPWKKSIIEGFYHDCSILFDDDNKTYIVYGNKQVYLTELKPDLSGPLQGGLHRMVANDDGNPSLGYEGTHIYKINGKYYLFFIHSLSDHWRRVEACLVADSLDDEFIGGDCLNDDMGYCNQGIAQGGIVDTPEGKWFAILFQDRGAVGRIPVLIPVTWKDDYPVFGEQGRIPEHFSVNSTKPSYEYHPLVESDDFKEYSPDRRLYGSFGLKSCWQFNHEPDLSLVKVDREYGKFTVTTGKVCKNVTQARNTLTQRMLYPCCSGEVTIDVSGLREGDYAGLCALQSCYGFAAVTKRDGKNYLVMRSQVNNQNSPQKESDIPEGQEWETIPFSGNSIRLKVVADFTNMKDEAEFYYQDHDIWKKIGITQKLFFMLDHFTGCRFGLFIYATRETGGSAS
ncbi:MAG TPA: family 43 glycosylhydrolase, partial [Lachnospiraceae bacterium]|nr:family 43 glycosylhydrolase [Lachnospiraceae bacterium]